MHSFGSFCNGLFVYGRYNPGGFIMMGIGVILIVALIYLVIRKGSSNNDGVKDTPLDLLQKRFVSGEIDESEYLKRKGVLEDK